MKRLKLASFILLALSAFGPLGLTRCGGTATEMGTETGNPPVINKQKLRLEWTPDGVELIGEPGAVTAGAEVRLTNVRTGESAQGNAGADGSINLRVTGEVSDPYEVRVSSAGGQATEPVAALDGTSATLDRSSCLALENSLGQTLVDNFARADVACSNHADCVEVGWSRGADCYEGCGVAVLSQTGDSAVRAEAQERTALLCAELARCQRVPEPCPAPPPSVPLCIDGSCASLRLEELSCEELSNQASLRREAAMDNAERSCAQDDDCTLVRHRVRCFPECGGLIQAVRASATQAVADAVVQVEATYCGQFDVASCPPPMELPCAPLPTPLNEPAAICRSSRCEVDYQN